MVLNGTLEDIMIFFTKDTGAVKSVISKRIYDNTAKTLEKSSMLTTGNGDPLVEFGKTLFKIKLSNVELSFEFIVAKQLKPFAISLYKHLKHFCIYFF